MEFGLHETLPIYSGGLGVLAGDHLKESSDLGLPLTGVGFMYAQGYFSQRISEDGWQEALTRLKTVAAEENRALPELAPRILLRLTDEPVEEAAANVTAIMDVAISEGVPDFVLNIMNPFYLDLGFDLATIAEVRKGIGVAMLMLGVGGLGGWVMRGSLQTSPGGLAALAQEAAYSYSVYAPDRVRPVEMRASDSAHLLQWVSDRLKQPVKLPEPMPVNARPTGCFRRAWCACPSERPGPPCPCPRGCVRGWRSSFPAHAAAWRTCGRRGPGRRAPVAVRSWIRKERCDRCADRRWWHRRRIGCVLRCRLVGDVVACGLVRRLWPALRR